MKSLIWITAVLTVFCLMLSIWHPASAETNLNLYFGASNIKVNDISADLDGGRSAVIGGRLEYWAQQTPFLGIGFDVSSFKTGQDNLLTESVMAILRVPLGKDVIHSQGRFFPYLALGPALITGPKIEPALDLRLGAQWLVDINIGFFAEHRLLNGTGFDVNQFIGGVAFKF